MGLRASIAAVSIVIAGVIVGFFVTQYMGHTPPTVTVSTSANTVEGRPVVDVTFTTVAAVGSGLHPNWVAYLNSDGNPSTYFHVPAGSVVRDGSGKVAHELSLTAIPIDRPPFPLPPSKVPVYFTVQPGGGSVFPDGVQVVYPNYTHEAPGTRMNFWAYDPDAQGWHVYGKGTVTPDAKQVVPDADTKVYRFTGAMTVVPGYNPPT
ncbi:MAG TPA: hypothetical protein VKJ07_00325, partial [Mycobacteriales bacterium]|nr:hypothetical protein [Mycobacteriales bacterium]